MYYTIIYYIHCFMNYKYKQVHDNTINSSNINNSRNIYSNESLLTNDSK